MAEENKYLESEELLLRNTFVNSQMNMNQGLKDFSPAPTQMHPPRLRWVDLDSRGRQDLAVEDKDENDLVNLINPPKVIRHRVTQPQQLRSAIRKPVDHKKFHLQYPSKVFQGRVGFLDAQPQPRFQTVKTPTAQGAQQP